MRRNLNSSKKDLSLASVFIALITFFETIEDDEISQPSAHKAPFSGCEHSRPTLTTMPSQHGDYPLDCVSVEQEHAGKMNKLPALHKSCFSVGSLFTTPDVGGGPVTIRIPNGLSLTITSATYRNSNSSSGSPQVAELSISTDAAHHVPLCNVSRQTTVAGLGLVLVGPQKVKLSVTTGRGIYVIGSVSPALYEYQESKSRKEHVVVMTRDGQETNHVDGAIKATTPKKRKLSNANDHVGESSMGVSVEAEQQHDSEESSSSPHLQNETLTFVRKEAATKAKPPNDDDEEEESSSAHLSKRQRKKLAKKKAKELAAAVAVLNKHESQVDSSGSKQTTTKKPSSLTKERRLPSGVLVKDIIVGTGGHVKLGRKVKILYEGAFLNGRVFDKNKNRNHPLTFRQGTGEVIKGLEKGIEGMKVGGEREITIPPDQGYGKAGSGPVPPNSTLVFSIQLVGLG